MEYTITHNNETITLPAYIFKIAEKLEKQEAMNLGNSRFKDKCKSMYELEKELLGAGVVDTLLGKFENTDPNDINILYLKIVRAYAEPIDEFNNQNINEQLDISKADKLVEIVNALEKANTMKVIR